MKKTLSLSAIALLCASSAFAGGLDRSGQSVSALFEDGRVMGFSFGMAMPDISGNAYGAPADGVAQDYMSYGLSYKADLNNQFSYAVILDQPYGAKIEYPDDAHPVVAGANAEVTSNAVTILGQYNVNDRVSVYGGPRIQQLEGTYEIPTFGVSKGYPAAAWGYNLESDPSTAVGYSFGTAYEIKDYALRIALTYHSAIEHDLEITETTAAGPSESTMTVTMPQAVNLDFQTGVNEKTLVFGGVRWAEWSAFELAPQVYKAATGSSVINLEDDTMTYTLGVGRKITDQWSLAGSISHEAATGGEMSLLAPTDGQTSYGLAAIFDNDDIRLSVGARYVQLGDTSNDTYGHEFKDNTAMGVGVSISKRF